MQDENKKKFLIEMEISEDELTYNSKRFLNQVIIFEFKFKFKELFR